MRNESSPPILRNPDAIERIRKEVRQLRILQERISRLEELAYTILAHLEGLIEEADRRPAMSATPASDSGPRAGYDRAALRRMAESGVVSVKIERRADGSAHVRIGPHVAFDLPPMLADLLEILCRDSGPGSDGVVGWKRRDEVRVHLSKSAEREIGDHALTHAIYRLRRELVARGGVNPYLLQTSSRGEMRFAVQRRSSAQDPDTLTS
jgi:hypothetical protein